LGLFPRHDGVTPHPSNARATILDDPGAWFGFEQEYFLYQDGRPLGFPEDGVPPPQGPYYTGVGYKNVGDVARQIVEEHLDLCLDAGINHEGINAEVAKGQWEFQIGVGDPLIVSDHLWLTQWLLQCIGDKMSVAVLKSAYDTGGRKHIACRRNDPYVVIERSLSQP
jgi:glutamine synthetase